jgi:hypothetical protein
MSIDVYFLDAGREPKQKPDPAFPNGKPVILAMPIEKSCTYNLPYPAPRCGLYEIKCRTCGFVAAITVAGRPDDPNMISMPCKEKGMN